MCSEELDKSALYVHCLFKTEKHAEGMGTLHFLLVYACAPLFKEALQKVEKKEDILLLADVTPETQAERGQRSLLLWHWYVTFSPTLTPLLYIGYRPQLKLGTSACLPSHMRHGADDHGGGCLQKKRKLKSSSSQKGPLSPVP